MLYWLRQVGTILPCPANHAPPPRCSSNSFKIFRPVSVTFSPTVRLRKSFSCNTYGSPRKCCKQKTCGRAKPFRCNTYKKHGGAGILPVLEFPSRHQRSPLTACTRVRQ